MKFNCKTTKDLLKKIKNEDIKMVDLRFTDLPGSTHHISIPIKFLTENLFVDGIGFDGSSVRGFQSIENSDMTVVPAVSTGYLDPLTFLNNNAGPSSSIVLHDISVISNSGSTSLSIVLRSPILSKNFM